MKVIFRLVLFVMVAVACNKNENDSRLAERSEVEAKAQIKAEEERAAKMVADLRQQARFYESIYGEFEGTLVVGGKNFKLRANFVPKSPIYISRERTLTISEVEEYLINQSFNIHLTIWNPSNELSVSGCQVQGVKPDILKGEIYVSSEVCPNLFLMAINDESLNDIVNLRNRYDTALGGVSKELAKRILGGEVYLVEEIVGEMKPVTNSSIYSFRLVRVP